jgi:hypothetical protein
VLGASGKREVIARKRGKAGILAVGRVTRRLEADEGEEPIA